MLTTQTQQPRYGDAVTTAQVPFGNVDARELMIRHLLCERKLAIEAAINAERLLDELGHKLANRVCDRRT